MNTQLILIHVARAVAFLALTGAAQAHVSLEQSAAPAGSTYKAVLRVGHGCEGSATTGITVQIPAGFANAQALPRTGWTATQSATEVRWTAAGRAAALADGQKGEFALTGNLPQAPGALWFKVLQNCEKGSNDWSQIPASGTSVQGLKTPAVLLDVLDPRSAAALVQVEGAWARASVPGQMGTGAFMKLTAREGMRLVAAASPAAGVAEVHEMKMEGDVMRMRAVPALDLPAGKAVELKPGGYHVMLMDLKAPLVKDSSVPLTLTFKDAKGVESKLELKVPVSAATPPQAGAGAMMDGHKH